MLFPLQIYFARCYMRHMREYNARQVGHITIGILVQLACFFCNGGSNFLWCQLTLHKYVWLVRIKCTIERKSVARTDIFTGQGFDE